MSQRDSSKANDVSWMPRADVVEKSNLHKLASDLHTCATHTFKKEDLGIYTVLAD